MQESMLKDMDFCHLQEIYVTNTENNRCCYKNRTRCFKTASKNVVHKATEATGEFIGNIITNKIVKSKHVPDENLKEVEEMVIPPEKREEILNKLRQVL